MSVSNEQLIEALRLLSERPDVLRAALELAGQQPRAPEAVPLISELWGKYETHTSPRLKSWQSVHATRGRHILAFFGNLRADANVYSKADEYVAMRRRQPVLNTVGGKHERLVSPNTIAHELDTLRAMFYWALRRKLVIENPLAGYVTPAAPTKVDPPLTEEQVARVIESARPPLWRLMLVVALETGMRRDEWRLLTHSEVNINASRISLPANRTKEAQPKRIPLSDLALAAIQAAPRMDDGPYVFPSPLGTGGPASETTVDTWWRNTLTRAGLPHRRLHSTRGTFATISAMKKRVPIAMLMRWLGHSSKDVHDHYVQLTDDYAADELEYLNGRRMGPHAAEQSPTPIVALKFPRGGR